MEDAAGQNAGRVGPGPDSGRRIRRVRTRTIGRNGLVVRVKEQPRLAPRYKCRKTDLEHTERERPDGR